MDAPATGISGNRPKRCIPNSLALAILLTVLLPILAPAQSTPGGFEDLALRASAAREQNDVPKAVDLYGQAVQLNPKWPDGWWFLGLLQYGSDQYAAARDSLTQYIKLTPNAGPAIALRGLC
jgi:tetratricopeptide (TPR) repeat protein